MMYMRIILYLFYITCALWPHLFYYCVSLLEVCGMKTILTPADTVQPLKAQQFSMVAHIFNIRLLIISVLFYRLSLTFPLNNNLIHHGCIIISSERRGLS